MLPLSRCLLLASCLLSLPRTLRADSLSEAQAILKEGCGSPDQLQQVERRYELLEGSPSRDADVDYAVALVRLKYHKYDLALAALDSATTSRPSHLPAWRAKFWLLVFQRKHDTAIGQMQTLANIYPAGEKAEPVETELAETARWMGRLHGHLTWAAAGTRPAMEQHTEKVKGKLTGLRLTAFDEARQEVKAACEKLQLDLAKIQTEDAADEAKRRELATESNKKKRTRITTERAALQTESVAAKGKFDGEMEELKAQLAPFEKQYNDLQRKAKPILDHVSDLERQATNKDRDANNEKDQNRKRNLQNDADRLRNQARDEQRKLDPIERDIRKVEGDAARLNGQRAKLAAAFQAYAVGVNQKLALFARDETTVERSEKALIEPAKATPRQAAMQSKIAAVSTYRRFPIEEERLRILDLKR